MRERATTFGLVAAAAVAFGLVSLFIASNAQTLGVATARASMTPLRPTPTQRVVSYQSLGRTTRRRRVRTARRSIRRLFDAG